MRVYQLRVSIIGIPKIYRIIEAFRLTKKSRTGRYPLSNINWKCASQICQWIFKRSKLKKNWHNNLMDSVNLAGHEYD